jgi:hypothetical protein
MKNLMILALITGVGSARKIETQAVKIVSIIPLQESKCPVNKETGEVIPKSILRLADGSTIGVLTNNIKNAPVAIPAEGMDATVSYENVEVDVTERDAKGVATGKKVKGTVSNILNVEFDSTLRFIVANAKQVNTAGVR